MKAVAPESDGKGDGSTDPHSGFGWRHGRIFVIILALLSLLLAAWFGRVFLQPGPTTEECVQLVRAVYDVLDMVDKKGHRIFDYVEVDELVQLGLVSADLARGFKGSRVSVFRAEVAGAELGLETSPQQVLLRLDMADGRGWVMLGDGRIQSVISK